MDISLSSTTKRVLAYAAEEADRLGHQHITEHLLLGLLREKDSIAATVLRQEEFDAEELRRAMSDSAEASPAGVIGARGYVFGSGSASGRNAAVEFVWNGTVIASVVLFPGSPVPRQDEKILLKIRARKLRSMWRKSAMCTIAFRQM